METLEWHSYNIDMRHSYTTYIRVQQRMDPLTQSLHHTYDNHVRSEVFRGHVGAINQLFSDRHLSTLWVTSVHTHTICHECLPGSKVNLCTGPIWTYEKPYLEPPIPLRVRHVGTNNHPVATLDRVGTAKCMATVVYWTKLTPKKTYWTSNNTHG